MKKIEHCKYDSAMNIIAAYQCIPFEPKHGDGGYAVRVIEIYRLFKMERSLSELETITGYDMPTYQCEPDEINFLIERGTAICNAAQEAVKDAELGVKRYGGETDPIPQNMLDVKQKLMSMKEAMRHIQEQRRRAQDAYEREKLVYQARVGLLGLLRPVVEEMLKNKTKGFVNKVMDKLPLALLPEYTYRTYLSPNGFECQSHIYAWSYMNELQKAVEEILRHCQNPICKYELNHNGIARAEFNRQYYSPEGEIYRQLMPVKDYASLMLGTLDAKQSKQRMMKNGL